MVGMQIVPAVWKPGPQTRRRLVPACRDDAPGEVANSANLIMQGAYAQTRCRPPILGSPSFITSIRTWAAWAGNIDVKSAATSGNVGPNRIGLTARVSQGGSNKMEAQ
jgi:hypothetical protein